MALGKFSVNITKCPTAADGRSLSVPNEVGAFFELSTTKVYEVLSFFIAIALHDRSIFDCKSNFNRKSFLVFIVLVRYPQSSVF